jgi:hypothetical protein
MAAHRFVIIEEMMRRAGSAVNEDWSSDTEVRKLSGRPLMRTSESRELQQLIVFSSGFEFEIP